MAEKQRRRLTLIPTPKSLRNTFKKRISRKFGRLSSLISASTMQSTSATMATDENISISTCSSRSRRSTLNFSLTQHHTPPSSSDEIRQREGINDGNLESLQYWKILRVRRFVPYSNPAESLPRSQTTVGLDRRSMIAPSRIPTPTKPPKGNLYSHSVYQTEGRRSVISPAKRRFIMGHQERANVRLNDENETRLSIPQAYPAAQRRILMFRKPAAQYKDESNQQFVKMTPTPTLAQLPMRKVRVGRTSDSSTQYLLPRYYQKHSQVFSIEATTEISSINAMASPKRVKLTQKFNDLKKLHETPRTKLPIPKQSSKDSPSTPAAQRQTTQAAQTQAQVYEQAKENDAPATYLANLQLQPARHTDVAVVTPKATSNLLSKLPLASTSSSGRRKTQGEKMVSAQLQPICPHNVPRSAAIPCRFSNPGKSMLMEHPDPRPQVQTAMPSQYWLGRFMSLTNAFHYEDSFGEPDIATGFEMPSSYSRPFQGSDDGDLAGYRVKRAFMALENLCATEEASESLREFREAYIRRFGDRWMA
ncbi:hypothetical protein BJX68DRAFT_219396 [Aspergillus pseudodeflectus]|uniref:Uncharacterized protein n=1 Tax=Aspergillus pseudodeflectus TaxID=176178 RepID=A0ABR4JFH7_9EURO